MLGAPSCGCGQFTGCERHACWLMGETDIQGCTEAWRWLNCTLELTRMVTSFSGIWCVVKKKQCLKVITSHIVNIKHTRIKRLIKAITSFCGAVGNRNTGVLCVIIRMQGQLWLAEFFLTDHNILLRTLVGNLEFLTLAYFTTSRGLWGQSIGRLNPQSQKDWHCPLWAFSQTSLGTRRRPGASENRSK